MSKLITYPSTIDKKMNHTVIIVDADLDDIERVGLFLKVANKEYDIYLYREDLDDLQWLHHVTEEADRVLINESSPVTILNCGRLLKVGPHQDTPNALEYFLTYDSIQETT